MKIIRLDSITPEIREDGRLIYSILNYKNLGNLESKFFRVKIPAGIIEDEHFHKDSNEIFIFLKPGKIRINKNLYSFNEGDVVILEKGEKHNVIAEQEMDLFGIKDPNLNDKVIVKDENN